MERDTLPSVAAFFTKESTWSSAWWCRPEESGRFDRCAARALSVSRDGFYAWITRLNSKRERLVCRCPHAYQSFVASDRTYGARRVLKDVLELGSPLVCKIEQLTKAQVLRVRPRAKPTSRADRSQMTIGNNLLDR